MITRNDVEAALRQCLDPEIGLDIWTLGFVRQLDLTEDNQRAKIVLTLTSPMCPFSSQMVGEVRRRLTELGLRQVEIELSFDPPWEPSPEVRLLLGS